MPSPQVITFAQLPNLATKPAAALTLVATSDSALTVAFSVVSGPATVSGTALTITGAGTIVVRASQSGNGSFNAATPVDNTFTVASLSADEVDALCRSAGAGREAMVLGLTLGYCLAAADPVTHAKVEAAQQNGHTPYTAAGRAAIAALVAAA